MAKHLNQSEVKPKLIMTCARVFPRFPALGSGYMHLL